MISSKALKLSSFHSNDNFTPIIDKVNINNLINDDCLKEIFSYLTILERLSAAVVCKKWNQIIEDSWLDVKDFCVNSEFIEDYEEMCSNDDSLDDLQLTKFIINIIKKCGCYLTSINWNFQMQGVNILLIVETAAKYCKKLKNFNLIVDFYEDKHFDLLFKNNPKLDSIKLRGIRFNGKCFSRLTPNSVKEITVKKCVLYSISYFFKFLMQLKYLEKLNTDINISNTEVISALNNINCESISTFQIPKYEPLQELSELLFKQKKLKKIDLGYAKVTTNFMDYLPNECLESLKLKIDYNLSNYSFCKFQKLKAFHCEFDYLGDQFLKGLAKCKRITELNFSVRHYYLTKNGKNYFSYFKNLENFKICYNKNMDSILKSLSQCKNLTILDISSCKFTSDGIRSLTSASNLKSLDLSRTDINNEDLIHLVSNLQELSFISLRSCGKVSSKSIEKINKILDNRIDLSNSYPDYQILTILHKYSEIFPSELEYISPLLCLEP